jgi:hypothetical protein
MLVKYSSNNSGGSWWLKDADWLALEAAGWKVEWHRDREDEWFKTGRDGRWLGSLAGSASKDFPTPADAIREWERITGQDASDDGCNCCGAPHSFSWDSDDADKNDWGYASGSSILSYLYANPPTSLREAARRLSGEDA